MPTYPTPGRAIGVSGLNKDQGWGSRTAGGQVIAGHAGDQGIAHTVGLSKLGLDSNNNPIISSTSVTAITGTGATINWTSVVSQPNGVVRYRNLAVGGAYTTVNETGGPRTTHTVSLTGLTAGVIYEYEVTQPSNDGKNQAVFQGRITAGLALGEDPQQAPQQPAAPQLGDTTGI
ncbi:MAG: fibronectin type III domain-containing protein, partial [Solirubrobacteraceae bacterium]